MAGELRGALHADAVLPLARRTRQMAQVRGKMRSVRKAPMRLVVAQLIGEVGEEFADRLAHILIGIASIEGEASEAVIDLAWLKACGE